MSFQYSPYAVPLFVAGVITIALAWYALRMWRQAEARIFGLMMIALSWWSLAYALSISGADLRTHYLLNRLKYVGVLTVPPLWLALALRYTHHQASPAKRNLALIFVPAALLLPMVLTNPLTELWWKGIYLGEFNSYPVLRSAGRGPMYLVHIATSYLYILLGLWLYLRFYIRTEHIYRRQALLMIVAATIPLVANVVTQMGLSPLPWGLDSFFFTASGLLMAVAIFRYRFLDIVPVARQAIVEQMPESVIVVDAHGRIVDANPAARTMLQVGTESIVGHPLTASVQIPELREALLEIERAGWSQPSERDIHLASEDEGRVFSLKTSPLTRGGARPAGQIILLQDISEQVAVRKALEELYHRAEIERQRLDLTIRTANEAIILLDTRGQVLASNPSARGILRASQSSQFPPALQKMLSQAKRAADVTKAEIGIGDRCFHAAAAPVPGTGLVLTMHDITHLKELARLKDEFVTTASHDLRTPLSAILGYAQLAQFKDVSPEERQDALQRIETSVQRMADLVNDLLDLAKLEAGITHTAIPVTLDKLAREAVEELEGAALAKGLHIQTELHHHPPLYADPRLILRMWRNLIENAIKYTNDGKIIVRVRPTENQVIGQVADTGVGIPPADLPYVFDKFFRVESPTVDESSGTGLGLSLVKRIVEEYGGQVWVESEVNVGSTFTLTFPLPR